MPVKGYYTRAKVFGYIMLVAAVGYVIYYLYITYST
jgi:hypothetical protein